ARPDPSPPLKAGDVVGPHEGKEMVGVVVPATMTGEKPPILPLPQPSLGRAVGRRRLAVRPFAGRTLRAQPTVLVGLDPDAVEQGRVAFHDRSVCAPQRDSFKT